MTRKLGDVPGWDVENQERTGRWTIYRTTRRGTYAVRRGRGRPSMWWRLLWERRRYPIREDER